MSISKNAFRVATLLSVLVRVVVATGIDKHRRDGSKPAFPYDASTTKYCSYWLDNDRSSPCSAVPDNWFISMADFIRWNPSVGSGCTNFKAQFSYCVEALNEPPPSSTTPTTTAPPTTTPKPTTVTTSTTTRNGITTPTPIQTGMVGNCDKFYYVNPDEKCQTILDNNGITMAQFFAWNPAIGASCGGLWAKTYACVHLLGSNPVTITSKPTTTTTAGNGISTPKPTQPGMVGDCNAFYLVPANEGCAAVASQNGITLAQFYAWNPQAGTDCKLLQTSVYACVAIIGYVRPTTTKGNGVTTPTPIQTGMTTSCKIFHYVAEGEPCDSILKAAQISLAQFVSWNPAAGSGCNGLWAKTYCCIAVL